MLRGFLWYEIIVFYPRKHINKISCIKLSIYVCDNCVFKYEYDFGNSYSYDTLTIKIKLIYFSYDCTLRLELLIEKRLQNRHSCQQTHECDNLYIFVLLPCIQIVFKQYFFVYIITSNTKNVSSAFMLCVNKMPLLGHIDTSYYGQLTKKDWNP